MHNSIPGKQTISDAHERILPYIHRTPVLSSSSINERLNMSVFFKCENLQKVGAFKARGGFNTALQLSEEEKTKGLATHSSGNHAQAVAIAAQTLGIPAYIVMPSTAPAVKKAAVKGYGAKVIECEPTLQARETTVEEVVEKHSATFIHPYNDHRIITGQATAAKELIEECLDLDYIFTPIGGGGLLSGTSLSAHYFSGKTKVIGCEPEGADDAYRSFKTNKLVPQTDPNTIADGLLTSLGKLPFEIIQQHVENILLTNDEEIIAAMRLIWERMKIVIEPSAAVPLAALIRNKERFTGKTIGIIISGGNVDLERLPF